MTKQQVDQRQVDQQQVDQQQVDQQQVAQQQVDQQQVDQQQVNQTTHWLSNKLTKTTFHLLNIFLPDCHILNLLFCQIKYMSYELGVGDVLA